MIRPATISSADQLAAVRDVLGYLGAGQPDFDKLNPADVNLEDLDEYHTFTHPKVLGALVANVSLSMQTAVRLLDIRRLVQVAEADASLAWTEDAYVSGGYWRAVHTVAVQALQSLETAGVDLPVAA